jgi:metal-responsive CopG/Arc/MetJ family transcriptional regulator
MVTVRQKRIGRPPTGVSPAVAVRLEGEELDRVDRFAKANGISRSQALRRLIHRGLSRAPLLEEDAQRPRPKRRRGLAR